MVFSPRSAISSLHTFGSTRGQLRIMTSILGARPWLLRMALLCNLAMDLVILFYTTQLAIANLGLRPSDMRPNFTAENEGRTLPREMENNKAATGPCYSM